jgi:hypothetical protein
MYAVHTGMHSVSSCIHYILAFMMDVKNTLSILLLYLRNIWCECFGHYGQYVAVDCVVTVVTIVSAQYFTKASIKSRDWVIARPYFLSHLRRFRFHKVIIVSYKALNKRVSSNAQLHRIHIKFHQIYAHLFLTWHMPADERMRFLFRHTAKH